MPEFLVLEPRVVPNLVPNFRIVSVVENLSAQVYYI